MHTRTRIQSISRQCKKRRVLPESFFDRANQTYHFSVIVKFCACTESGAVSVWQLSEPSWRVLFRGWFPSWLACPLLPCSCVGTDAEMARFNWLFVSVQLPYSSWGRSAGFCVQSEISSCFARIILSTPHFFSRVLARFSPTAGNTSGKVWRAITSVD